MHTSPKTQAHRPPTATLYSVPIRHIASQNFRPSVQLSANQRSTGMRRMHRTFHYCVTTSPRQGVCPTGNAAPSYRPPKTAKHPAPDAGAMPSLPTRAILIDGAWGSSRLP
jgi:hypothetical protein